MRIIAGEFRGRALRSPHGAVTRPTAGRMRQALFDMLLHASWGGMAMIAGARVLDAFAGTGALGLEALSRGARFVTFLERDRAALAALAANIAACGAAERARIVAADALAPPRGAPCGLVFLDPPYGGNLVPRALEALDRACWIAPGALVIAEIGRDEIVPDFGETLAERSHGAARIIVRRRGA